MASSKGRLFFRIGLFVSKGEKLVHLRPLDGEGLHGGHEEAYCSMPALSIRYWQFSEIVFVWPLLYCFIAYVFVFKTIFQIATTSPTRQQSPRLSSGDSPDDIQSISIKGFENEDIFTALVTRATWTWVRSATWPPPLWQCGNQASSRLTETRQQATSMQHQGRWGGTSQTLRGRGSS